MNEREFTIEITPVFMPSIVGGFGFIATWKGVISMSGFDPDYYNAERRAQSEIDDWKRRDEERNKR